LDLQPDGVGGFLRVPQCDLGGHIIGRIDEHGNANGVRHQFMQESQPLCDHLLGEKIVTSQKPVAGANCEGRVRDLDATV
jgi:hypothetical protein